MADETFGITDASAMGGEDRASSSPHFLLDRSRTYTPTTPRRLKSAAFNTSPSPTHPTGRLEVGCFRVSDEARIATVEVQAAGAGWASSNFAGDNLLSPGVTYCRGFRIIADVSIAIEVPGDTGARNASLTGANALANPFGSTADDLSADWAINITTEDAAQQIVLGSRARIQRPMGRGPHKGPFARTFRPMRGSNATRQVLLQIFSSPGVPLPNTALNFWTAVNEAGVAIDGIAPVIQRTTDANGYVLLQNLKIAAGVGQVRCAVPGDPSKSRNFTVTFY